MFPSVAPETHPVPPTHTYTHNTTTHTTPSNPQHTYALVSVRGKDEWMYVLLREVFHGKLAEVCLV